MSFDSPQGQRLQWIWKAPFNSLFAMHEWHKLALSPYKSGENVVVESEFHVKKILYHFWFVFNRSSTWWPSSNRRPMRRQKKSMQRYTHIPTFRCSVFVFCVFKCNFRHIYALILHQINKWWRNWSLWTSDGDICWSNEIFPFNGRNKCIIIIKG